ncbi:oxidoreductase [Psychromarinibacter sp. C21-152]|uniref:Oxidoreductase n=1 Tax=Psychromarinibacter sediminicola TaxID=3033385 RepID=A0AAE3NTK2_9RHOB|nr:oxidoreductase [Psychromarinibacter sediminicola]MDF0600660.1 oxidoreductase [Psychromarinibacter sediminicola]
MDAFHADTHALITGGAQGLGLAVARELIAQGCRRLVLADRNREAGQAAAEALSGNGVDAGFHPVDMGDAQAAQDMVDAAAGRMGRVTALVNAAALTDRGSILDTTPDQWDRIQNANARGPFFALQRFAQRCIDAGHPGGCVNILSIVVHGGLPFLAPYGASKASLLYTTKNAANTLARHRIRVNGINVGWMDTPAEDAVQRRYHDRAAGWQAEAAANLPFGALVQPEQVARQTAFFLGPQSGVVTGSVMDFDQRVIGAYPDTNDT